MEQPPGHGSALDARIHPGPAECRGVPPIGVDHMHIPDERTNPHRQIR
jgi:hypothetical protein